MTKDQVLAEQESIQSIPLLLSFMKKMGLQKLIDRFFKPHGNWKGLPFGLLSIIWLSFLISRRNHCLSHLEPWAASMAHTLTPFLPDSWDARLFNDNRLGVLLCYFNDDESWQLLENYLNRWTIRVFDLNQEVVRLDATTLKGYWVIVDKGLFQRGKSKDKRPDLPQIKLMSATLDPSGMSLSTQTYPGHRADDKLYLPTYERVKASLRKKGLLFVGDCKMASLETRGTIWQGKDFYLTPLPLKQYSKKQRELELKKVWDGQVELSRWVVKDDKGEEELKAEGFIQEREVEFEKASYTEYLHFVRSMYLVEQAKENLMKRLKAAEAELAHLCVRKQGKRRLRTKEEAEQKVEAILAGHKVKEILDVQCFEEVSQRKIRSHGGRPERVEVEREVSVKWNRRQEAIEQELKVSGWRVYGTNKPVSEMSWQSACELYRESSRIDGKCFRRLKNDLQAAPFYLEKPEHVTGMTRLLSLGQRVLSLLEFEVGRSLEKEVEEDAKKEEPKEKIEELIEVGGSWRPKAKPKEVGSVSGLYAGNPKRKTTRPSGRLMLRAFEGVGLIRWTEGGIVMQKVAELGFLQKRILALLGYSEDMYLQYESIRGKVKNPP